ncbi:uncharacterized protein LOC114828417 [Galendromus occidentalis]|uniref:Uncharacterized protein LOC114828417 n=1 Tax=Galendromus occidentalis TaxID=34638 RepID=A0AAJ7WIN2_9ACAR|nr:uncharacterized protein LOC114828417 [Galendromus occidentalis]
MKRLLIVGIVLLATEESLAYGASRRRFRQFSTPAPQNSGYADPQYYPPVTHNCSSFQNIRTSDVHQVHHDVHRSSSELPHSHITHHVTPVVRSHVHQAPPVEVVRTTKTLYQPPAVVHQTLDYEHHDHVTTHYPGSSKSLTHTDYYSGKVNNVHTQSISEKGPSARKVLEVHHDDKFDTTVQQHQPHQQQHHHHHHHHRDDHAHFGKVPTGNAVVTSYFNFPGSGRSDNKFQAPAPAPSRKFDYLPQRSHSPAYSPLQAQSIEDDEDREDSPGPATPSRPLYERINAGTPQNDREPPPFYTGQAPESNSPSQVFPPPALSRPSDRFFSPSRYPKESFAERRRPEPLQLIDDAKPDDIKSSRDSENEDSHNPRGESPEGKTPGAGLRDPSALLKRFPEADSSPRENGRAGKAQDPNLHQQALRVKPDFFRGNREINAKEPQTLPENDGRLEPPLRYSLDQLPIVQQRPYFGP